ncbi:Uncharacterised protein [Burkholderia pseudomallei]|nr:Uncharacterised protein [Burkholderia pseudomallei]CAJ3907008.1 Uncharacterised protein [Burkholderia pseudomallei]CAJ4114066.1 Uncharacterised protein [Burkholderia pseudomallei]CAJ5180108.1 Uncharacterised protein [Burkholderia pseudomallei]CAJ6527035.1 Uncharacterised protein [Burkholderia pseudomallei]
MLASFATKWRSSSCGARAGGAATRDASPSRASGVALAAAGASASGAASVGAANAAPVISSDAASAAAYRLAVSAYIIGGLLMSGDGTGTAKCRTSP